MDTVRAGDEHGGVLNKEWHLAHVLGQGAPMEQRIAWHLAHAQACGCRPIPPSVQEAIAARPPRAQDADDARPPQVPEADAPVRPARPRRGPGRTGPG